LSIAQTLARWFGAKNRPHSIDQAQAPTVTRANVIAGYPEAQAPVSQFPRFRATANDQPSILGEGVFSQIRMRLLHAFTPSQPVSDRKRFSGRIDLLTTLIRAIEEQRLHIVLYGERGVGKTSALHVLTQTARDARYLVVYVSCGADSNFDEVFRTVAANIPMLFHSTVGPTSPEVEKGKLLSDTLPNSPISPRLASDLLSKIVGTRVVIVLDEFDRCESHEFRRCVAELIKNLSDRLVRVQVVIAGVAANLAELLEYIPSVQRNIHALQIPWMSDLEIKLLIQNGARYCGLRFSDKGIEAIVLAAHGSPYLASLICHHAGLRAVELRKSDVDLPEVLHAISVSMQEFSNRMSSEIRAKLSELPSDGPPAQALGTLASTSLELGGILHLSENISSQGTLVRIGQRRDLVEKLIQVGILMRLGGDDSHTYRFAEDGMAPYLCLASARSKLQEPKDGPDLHRPEPGAPSDIRVVSD
jgi:Cdc6-like AAA superfamily ATPase